MKMHHLKKTAVALALAAMGAGIASLSMPANAGLLSIRLTDPLAGTFLCLDNDVSCDGNATTDQIDLNNAAANAGLGVASVFNLIGISATSNFAAGDPLAAIITASGGVTYFAAAGGFQHLIIEISQTDWTKPVGSPRTLSVGPTTTFTNAGTGDVIGFRGFNDQANLVWAGNTAFTGDPLGLPAGSADDFVTPQVRFDANAGDINCGGVVGNIQTCQGQAQLTGIDETNPFSLSQRIAIGLNQSPVPGALNRLQFTSSVTKFASPLTVPEPASMLLVGAGLLGLVMSRRRKN